LVIDLHKVLSPSNMYVWDTHLWYLQFVIKVFARSFLHAMGPFSMWCVPVWHVVTHMWLLQLIIKISARSFLSWDPLASNQWNPTVYDLRVTRTYGTVLHLHLTYETRRLVCHMYLGTIRPMGFDGSCVTCTRGTFLYLHLTCQTRRLVPFVPLRSNKLKNLGPEDRMHGLQCMKRDGCPQGESDGDGCRNWLKLLDWWKLHLS